MLILTRPQERGFHIRLISRPPRVGPIGGLMVHWLTLAAVEVHDGLQVTDARLAGD